MNIVIPMAGRGKRFVDAGYKKPKPFIDVFGSPMIASVIQNLHIENQNITYIFICLQEFLNVYGDEFRQIIPENSKIVSVSQITEGAACTVLLSKQLINNDEELIIANCDQLVLDPCFMQGSIDFYRKHKAHGGILCFMNDSPKWSYVRMNGDKIIEVVEKQVVSNLATVGIYYYSKGSYFVQAAENMIENKIRVNNEFYVAPAYNMMLISGMKVIPYVINDMAGLGTPEDLERFLHE